LRKNYLGGDMATKRWKCSVCGYIHVGEDPPEKCPACGVDSTMFFQVDEAGKKIETKFTEDVVEVPTSGPPIKEDSQPVATKKVETPTEEPDSPVVEIEPEDAAVEEVNKGTKAPVEVPAKKPDMEAFQARAAENSVASPESPASEESKKEEPVKKSKRSFLDLLGAMVLKQHLHPITVHTPNGVLPMAVLFMVLAIFYNYPVFEQPAFFSLTFVLAVLPVVVLTGYLEWQMRYRGAKTFLFIVKIFCSLIVLASVSTLVIWRFIDPAVTGPDSPFRMIYLGVGVVSLVAAGIAGHLGGKLVFGRR
jgi:uncharacterized membrane protein